jgi:hypothetical protein
VNILSQFTFRLADVREQLAGNGGIWDYLANRWLTFSPSSEIWIMWDLALITALARPDLAIEGKYRTPPENSQREIHVYTGVKVEAMRQDWWNMVRRAQSNNVGR